MQHAGRSRAVKYSNGAAARRVHHRPAALRKASSGIRRWQCRPMQAEGETRLGDEVADNGTRLPAPSLDVRRPSNAQQSRPPARWVDLIRQRSGAQQRSTATLRPANVAFTVRQRSAQPHLTVSGSHAAPCKQGVTGSSPGGLVVRLCRSNLRRGSRQGAPARSPIASR